MTTPKPIPYTLYLLVIDSFDGGNERKLDRPIGVFRTFEDAEAEAETRLGLQPALRGKKMLRDKWVQPSNQRHYLTKVDGVGMCIIRTTPRNRKVKEFLGGEGLDGLRD